MSNTSKRAVYYQQAEKLYVENGFSLQIIEDLFDKKVTRRTISNWKNEFDWDGKRKKHLEHNKSLIEETRELVKIALDNAKADPSSKNIAAYKRAVDALKALEAVNILNPDTPEKESEGLTPEKAAAIRKEILGF